MFPLEYDPRIATFLEAIYADCGCAERLDRDPLALVASWKDLRDREVVGLIASVLAFGSVDLILRACRNALEPLGDAPASRLASLDEATIATIWGGFQYRFMFGKDMVALLTAIRRALLEYGSLESLFIAGDPGGYDIIGATEAFVLALRSLGGDRIRPNLLPACSAGSACKRLFLYLRWMIRSDAVDPGGWNRVDRARLIVPLDTHMFATCRTRLGFFGDPSRPSPWKVPNLAAALRATQAFRLYAPDDPVKYDFALTRPGIDPLPGDERYGCL